MARQATPSDRISIKNLSVDPPPREPIGRTAGEADRDSLLRVHLNEPSLLSLGELGRLFQDVQLASRSIAQTIGYRTPRRSTRVTAFEVSSLEIAVDVFGWAPQAAVTTAQVIVSAARALWEQRTTGVGVVGSVGSVASIWQLISALRRAKGQPSDSEVLQAIEIVRKSVVEIQEELRGSKATPRDRIDEEEVRRLSEQTHLPLADVRRAFRALEAINRTDTMIHAAAGGFVRAANSDEVAVIPGPNQARQGSTPGTPPLPFGRRF